MMDIVRKGYARRKRTRQAVLLGLIAIGMAVVFGWFSQLEPAPPSIDKTSLWIEAVERGPMTVDMRGLGKLVPEDVRWVASNSGGRVERIMIYPGTKVEADTILIELSNPELERESTHAELEWKKAESELVELEMNLQRELLERTSQVAVLQGAFNKARLQADLDQKLAKEGLIPELALQLSTLSVEELAKRLQLAEELLVVASKSARARVAAKKAQVSQLRGLYTLRKQQVEQLRVKAGISGVLQSILVEVGETVTAGANLGKVAVPGKLKAQIQLPEMQAKNVESGQAARINIQDEMIAGHVVRIDPAVQEGTVTVDVSLEEELPKGARPDLNVQGTIEMLRISDTLRMGRPSYSQANGTIALFKVAKDGNEAVRVQVRLGRHSATMVQVIDGLAEGDQVILSETSNWADYDRIRLH